MILKKNYQQSELFKDAVVGRIDISPNENGTPFFVQDKIDKNEKTNYSNAMQGLMENSLLSITFFSLIILKAFKIPCGQKYINSQINNTKLIFKMQTN